MAKHVWETHKGGECPDEGNCPICDGGLAVCKVCGLAEGSLTTDCPEVESYREHGDAVYDGREDYIEGLGWVTLPSPHSPECIKQHADQLRQSKG